MTLYFLTTRYHVPKNEIAEGNTLEKYVVIDTQKPFKDSNFRILLFSLFQIKDYDFKQVVKSLGEEYGFKVHIPHYMNISLKEE